MLKSLLSLFLQANCPLCQRPASDDICQYCRRQIESCKRKKNSQFWQGELPLFVWGTYGGKLKQAIAALKYDRQPQLGELMGNWLGQAWLDSSLFPKTSKLTVIPIPLHAKKIRERGFNQAELIARGFCQITGYYLRSQAIERIRETEAMFGLNPSQKRENIRDAFRLSQGSKKQTFSTPVLLIDDIYTTGTTVREAAQVLQAQKVRVYGVAAIASSK